MPRDGSLNYHAPFPDVAPDTTIASTVYNGFVNDIVQELNTPLPVSRGGTGGTDPASAMANLGGELFAQVVTNYDAFAFQPGSFHSLGSATASPVATHAFSGICYWTDANNMFIEATDQDDVKQPGGKWLRQKKAGLWSLWASMSGSVIISDTPPSNPVDSSLWWESDSGTLYVRYNDGDSVQWVVAVPVPDLSVYVQKSGDTMTGPLNVPTPPTGPSNAASKAYVDSSVATATALANNAVRYDIAQGLTPTQQLQARQNIYAAPFDAMGYFGMQVNGSMEVSQAIALPGTTNGGYIIDEWVFNGPAGTAGFSSAASYASTSIGYTNIIYAQANTAVAIVAATNYMLYQPIEGTRIRRLAWGTALAKPITIAFWSSYTVPGLYTVAVRNGSSNRSYCATYTHAVASVAQYNVITIPGDTTGTWPIDNTIAMVLIFTFAAGATVTAPSANTWNAGVFNAAPGQVNGGQTAGFTNTIFGVLVLPGIEAPLAARSPYIIRPYAEEENLCMRYWESGYASPGAPAALTLNSTLGWYGRAGTTTHLETSVLFKVRKRTLPTCQVYAYDGTVGSISLVESGSNMGGLFNIQRAAQDGIGALSWSAGTQLTTGNTYWFGWFADARM